MLCDGYKVMTRTLRPWVARSRWWVGGCFVFPWYWQRSAHSTLQTLTGVTIYRKFCSEGLGFLRSYRSTDLCNCLGSQLALGHFPTWFLVFSFIIRANDNCINQWFCVLLARFLKIWICPRCRHDSSGAQKRYWPQILDGIAKSWTWVKYVLSNVSPLSKSFSASEMRVAW